MGEINMSQSEQDALASIDDDLLGKLIDKALLDEKSGDLQQLPLSRCGAFVANELRVFQSALTDCAAAKAANKRATARDRLQRAAYRLSSAVSSMKQRMAVERAEGELFQVDDMIPPPISLARHLSVRVGFRWRQSTEGEWSSGSITFTHDVEDWPDYGAHAPKRKLSAARREEQLQEELHSEWQHMMRGSLYSVRDYFREGGDGAKIPKTFKAIVDPHGRHLNNFSMDFWRKRT